MGTIMEFAHSEKTERLLVAHREPAIEIGVEDEQFQYGTFLDIDRYLYIPSIAHRIGIGQNIEQKDYLPPLMYRRAAVQRRLNPTRKLRRNLGVLSAQSQPASLGLYRTRLS